MKYEDGSLSRILPAVIAAGCLAWSSPASAFQGQGLGQLKATAERAHAFLFHNVIVVCRVYRTGNIRHTRYCENGYVCAPNDKCTPGPAKLREMERKREEEARREAEKQRQRDAERARQAEQERQRAAAALQAERVRQLAQQHAGTQNPFGPASADCSTITGRNLPQGGRVNCNTGGTINRPVGPIQQPAKQPPAQAQVPQPRIPGFTPTVPGDSSGRSELPTQGVLTQPVQPPQAATTSPANNPSSRTNSPQQPNSSSEDEERRRREAQRRADCLALVPFTDKCEKLATRMGVPGQPNNPAVGSAEIDAGTGAFRACSLATCKVANDNCSDYPDVIRPVCRAFPVTRTCKIEVGFHLFYRANTGEFECQPNRPSYAEPAPGAKP